MRRDSGKARRTTRILVVDDDPRTVRLLSSLFEEEGIEVTPATSAAAAKDALRSSNWQFDLVLSDISMPGESGFDLLQWIKSVESPHPELPVLLTTAQLPEAENRVKGLAMGAVDYVVRPIDLKELVIRALHAIEHFQRVRSLRESLQDSENLAMVGRLLAASHHEIKNLAALVNLATDQAIKHFAPQGADCDESGQVALKTLDQASRLLTDVARSVSNLLDPGAAATRPVKLVSLVTDVMDLMVQRVSPFQLEFRRSAGDELVWVLGHSVRLKQVLINLILNAAEAIQEFDPPEGGHIGISMIIEPSVCRLQVRDNGIGFASQGERSEFEAFATTKKLRGGQGLGLWLCANMMQNIGGRLTLSSDGVGLGADAKMQMVRTEPEQIDDLDIGKYLADLD